MGVQFDPLSRDWRDDPYPVYRRLRDEAPVHWAAEMRAWCVSRYDDVQYVLRNPEIFSSRAMFTVLMAGGQERPPINLESIGRLLRFFAQTRQNPLQFHKTRMLIASDGPPHAAMRNIVTRGFTPRRIADWEPRIREIAAACVGRLHTGEPFDLVHDLAVPLPVTVIAEMIGIEPARHADFKRWSEVIIRNSTGEGRSEPFNAEITDAVIERGCPVRC